MAGETGNKGHFELPIAGLSLSVAPEHLWLSSTQPLRVITSAVVGSELAAACHVLSVHVPLQYDNPAPEDDLSSTAAALGIAGPFVGMLTAVDLSEVVVQVEQEGDITIVAVVTVGVGNLTAAGSASPGGTLPGTINVVLVVDADLTTGAMVNAIITATEAKTLALVGAGLHTKTGELASGTSSDSIVVGCTGRGRQVRYAGPATTVGLLAGRAVRRAVAIRLKEKV